MNPHLALACGVIAIAAPIEVSTRAQSTSVIPPIGVVLDQSRSTAAPFLTQGAARHQQVVDGAVIAPSVATLTGVAWRRDAQQNDPLPFVRVSGVQLVLSHTTATPATLATQFSANTGAGPVTLFLGDVDLPALPPVSALPPFQVAIAFSAPFLYQRSAGNLLIDVAIPGNTIGFDTWRFDAAHWGPGGAWGPFGQAGRFPDLSAPGVHLDGILPSDLAPGGRVSLMSSARSGPHPVVFNLGLSNLAAGSTPLPLDLGPFGAPGNALSSSIEMTFGPLVPTLGLYYAARFGYPIPSDPALGGAVWYHQTVHLAPNANALGAVLSHSLWIALGGRGDRAVTQVVGSNQPSASIGAPLFAGGLGGPVVELRGTFQ